MVHQCLSPDQPVIMPHHDMFHGPLKLTIKLEINDRPSAIQLLDFHNFVVFTRKCKSWEGTGFLVSSYCRDDI